MNTRDSASKQIYEFFKSDDRIAYVTGTNQIKKHKLVITLIEKYYSNAKVLFRVNAMGNLTSESFLGLGKQPIIGEFIKFGKNKYAFDSSRSRTSWYKSAHEFDFAILYPLNSVFDVKDLGAVEDLLFVKKIRKIFLITWIDHPIEYEKLLADFQYRHIIYDAEEENPEYHKKSLEYSEEL